MIGWIAVFYVLITVLGWVFYLGIRMVSKKEETPEWAKPAGRIHLFKGDRYLSSDPVNAFEHQELDWNSGKLGVIMSDVLVEHPNYQPALIGTIQIFKPDIDAGQVACIIDNEIVGALGLSPAGLTSGAEWAIRGRVCDASLKMH